MHIQLKEASHYEDRYDLYTIKRCLEIIDFWKKELNNNKYKETDNKIKAEAKRLGSGLQLYYTQGERYKDRDLTIKQWMDEDCKLDEFFEKVKEPQSIRCQSCLTIMKNKSKDLWNRMEQPFRVLFLFECPKCQKRRGIFDDGQEFKRTPDYCAKCKKEITASFKQEGAVSVWERHCAGCGFIDREIENSIELEAKSKDQRLKDEELLRKYRAEFCFNAEEGARFILETDFMKELYETSEKTKQKEADPDYAKVTALKRIGIVELENLLSASLQEQKYVKLSIQEPEISKYVIVPFTVQDADPTRNERDSEYALRKSIKKIVEGTNWRLMQEGVSYRLGYLSGRLKGYEQEDDLLKVVKESVE